MLNRAIDPVLLDSYSDDIPTFLKKIYAARGVAQQHLCLDLPKLLQPNFSQLNKALVLLEKALMAQKCILIVGDFDCDGATASVVAVKSLRMMGAQRVDFLVPNRFEHGYGLSVEIVKLAIKQKQPDVIITVDNGISSFEGCEFAKKSGIEVIITDHHLPSETLPAADAIINPNLKDCNFESKNLAGVGVCFYLFSALKTHLSKTQYFTNNNIASPDLRTVLDLVALGTVADVVKLDQNNRILIAQGIERIRQKQCASGILALLEIANRPAQNLQASDLGFAVAPRLNAAGRLSDISRGIRCLLTDDMNDAKRYAAELEDFNQKRKTKQECMQTQADVIVKSQHKNADKFAISLFDNAWHEGIVGIVAGKLKEQYNCPCAVFSPQGGDEKNTKSPDFLKGSIRSIPSVHIKDLLDLIDRQNPELILKFGGHAMAAGLSIQTKNFEPFKQAFSQAIKQHLKGKIPTVELLTDGKLSPDDVCLDNAQLLVNAAPWGQGFEEPIFFGDFEIIEQKVVGEKHLKFQLKLIGTQNIYDGIAFFQNPIKDKKAKIAYKLSINAWRGAESLQLMIAQIDALE